jgi:DNA polymerase I
VTETRPRLFLIDGSSYIYRAFYATPPLNTSAGLPTNAIFGFINLLLKFLKRHKPEYVAVALDAGRETLRNQMFAGYKSRRPEPPAALLPQLPYFRRILDGLNVPLVELRGYEADDIIATLCDSMAGKNRDIVVVSSDKDLLQLVADGIEVLDGAKDRWIGAAEVYRKFGVSPEKVVQVMGLMGDAVDNIPGVRGIGAKTAIALIQQFDTLENLFRRLDEVATLTLRRTARVRKMLEEDHDAAFLSRDLATVRRDVPITIAFEELEWIGFNQEKLRSLFIELEFANLVTLLDNGRM